MCSVLVARAEAAEVGARPARDRYEPGVLPAIAADADVGLKLGAFVQLARFRGGAFPYAWRLQVLAATSVREGATGTEFPYRETFVKLDLPRVGVDGLRLLLDLSYLRTTNLGYYGLGNASEATRLWAGLPEGSDEFVTARRYYQYDGTAPQARVTALYTFAPRWRLLADASLRWFSIRQFPGSLLEAHSKDGAGAGQTLAATGRYVQPMLTVGIVHDSRDHETVPLAGHFHDVSLRCSPGSGSLDAYCGANAALRFYGAFAGERLFWASRVVGDVLFGPAPFIELARYGGFASATGPGGSRGVRGIPQGRLQGKTKLIGNLELRSFFSHATLGTQRFVFGAATFFDVGRVWTNPFDAVPALDGGSFELHWGAGGGPRVRWGDSLLIRADVAYAPLGAELGAAPSVYVDVEMVM